MLFSADHEGYEDRSARVGVAQPRAGKVFATYVTDCVRIWQY